MTTPTPPRAPTAGLAAPVLAAWQQVLAAQHEAIYGYGQLGPYLADATQQQQARTEELHHRDYRDALAATLVTAGVSPVAAQPNYRPTSPVTDAASARSYALALEERCSTAYRVVLVATAEPTTGAAPTPTVTGPLATPRASAVAGLVIAATAATTWRELITPDRPTVPFPGS